MRKWSVPRAIVVLLAGCAILSDQTAFAAEQLTPNDVIASYITAFNNHDAKALQAVVADSAKYVGPSGTVKPLVDQNLEAWKTPATASSLYGMGKLEEKDVIIVWARPTLADSTAGDWTKMAYLVVDVGDSLITHATGVLLMYDPEAQETVVGEPPKGVVEEPRK